MVASETPQPHHRPDLRPRGGQTALGQDQDQRREPERVRELGVVEADAEAGLAEGDPHQQVDEQAGQADPHAEAHREDRQQEHARPDQQQLVERLDVECHGRHLGGVVGGPRSLVVSSRLELVLVPS